MSLGPRLLSPTTALFWLLGATEMMEVDPMLVTQESSTGRVQIGFNGVMPSRVRRQATASAILSRCRLMDGS